MNNITFNILIKSKNVTSLKSSLNSIYKYLHQTEKVKKKNDSKSKYFYNT